MNLPWPEIPSTLRGGETLRGLLDYIHWASSRLLAVGAQAGLQREAWRDRIWRAYAAVFIPPVLGHGDPYPPDIPPALTPGIWPDIPAAGITGMTVRHQLSVLAMLASGLRQARLTNVRPQELAEWDRRLCRAREALEQGPESPMPAEARTEPSREAIDDMAAREKAIEDHAKRRRKQIQRMLKDAPAKGVSGKASGNVEAKAPAKKATPAKATPAKKTPAKTTAARATPAKAKPSGAKSPAPKKSAPRKVSGRESTSRPAKKGKSKRK